MGTYSYSSRHNTIMADGLDSPLKRFALDEFTTPSKQKLNPLTHSLFDQDTTTTTTPAAPLQAPAVAPATTPKPQTLASTEVQFTPVTKKLPPPTHNYAHQQPSPDTPTTTTIQSSRIPISLNPTFGSAGLKLGRKRLLERLRINLISLVIVWVITSTKVYNEVILTISAKIPALSVPLQIIEWLFLVIIIGNLLEGYYKLKTQVPITHVELPLTPQQIRGSLQASSKNQSTSGMLSPQSATKSSLLPFRRSQNLSGSIATRDNNKLNNNGGEVSPTSHRLHQYHQQQEILTKDPLINPLKSSTNHLFKRSIFQNTTDNNNNNNNSNSSLMRSETNYLRHSFPSRFNLANNLNSSTHSTTPPFINNLTFSNFPSSSNLFLSKSLRKVSNQDSLHKLLEETFAS